MSKNPKKKLCWNCEGSVYLEAESCPYCGVSVVPASLDGSSAGFTPPYRLGTVKETAVPYPPYISTQNKDRIETEQSVEKDNEENNPSIDDFKNVLISSILLLSGSVFFLFGLVLALFSQNGVFTLQWDASFWFVYSILSLPLLLFGWKILLKLDNDHTPPR